MAVAQNHFLGTAKIVLLRMFKGMTINLLFYPFDLKVPILLTAWRICRESNFIAVETGPPRPVLV